MAERPRPILRLPTHWTAEQAEAVLALLHQLVDIVWEAYEPALTDLARSDLYDDGLPDADDEPDDPVPF
jgi:hypothetical protein